MARSERHEYRSLFQKEIRIQAKLKHPNVVGVIGICEEPELISIMNYSQIDLADFAEFGEHEDHNVSNLRQLITHLDEYDASKYFEDNYKLHTTVASDIAKGLQYLHENEVVHRDLKPHNVLVNAENKKIICKLTDFGESRSIAAQTATLLHTKTHMLDRGTVVYNAPELLLHQFPSGATLDDLKKADIWSYGMILFSLLNPSLTHPWKKEIMNDPRNFKELVIRKMRDCKLPSHDAGMMNIDHMCQCYTLCCSYDIASRPSLQHVITLLSPHVGRDNKLTAAQNLTNNKCSSTPSPPLSDYMKNTPVITCISSQNRENSIQQTGHAIQNDNSDKMHSDHSSMSDMPDIIPSNISANLSVIASTSCSAMKDALDCHICKQPGMNNAYVLPDCIF